MSVRRNVLWLGTGQVARIGLQTGGLLLLSRLVAPEDVGLLAMALVVTNLALVLRDLGTAQALIQKADLDEETTASAFWLSSGAGLVVGGLIALAAPWASALYGEPELLRILLVLSLPFPISASSAVSQALLERRERFGTIAWIEGSSQAVALVVGLALAYRGWGAYSLVAHAATAPIAGAVQLWLAAGWRPRGAPDRLRLRSLARFTGYLSGFNLINYFARNADSLVIGRYIGAAALGPYALATRLMIFPVQNLTAVASRALLPAMSRSQRSPEVLGPLYLKVVYLIACVSGPLMMGLFVLREEFVLAVLGAQWASAVPIIAWLAPVGFIQSIVSTCGTVFVARGRTDVLFHLGIYSAVLFVASFVTGLPWGPVGIARLYFVANVLNALPCLYVALRMTGKRLPDLFGVLGRPAATSLLMGLVVAAANGLAEGRAAPAPARLLLGSLTAIAVYGLFTLLVNRPVIGEFVRLLRREA